MTTTTIELTAEAGWNYEGQQHIARITGRHPRLTFAREFIGRRFGKRNEATTARIDDPGLYVCRNVDRKGNKGDTFCLVFRVGDELLKLPEDEDEAMAIAKRLDAREELGCAELRELLRQQNLDDKDKDQEEQVEYGVSRKNVTWCARCGERDPARRNGRCMDVRGSSHDWRFWRGERGGR
jgi:hypothetical protein